MLILYRSGTSSSTSQASSSPTSVVTTDCPDSNNTTYTPPAQGGGSGQYEFFKVCGASSEGSDLAEAFVADFNNCVGLCSNWNAISYNLTGVKCSSVTFIVSAGPPGNCWAKNSSGYHVDGSADAALLL